MRTLQSMVLQTLEVAAQDNTEHQTTWMDIAAITKRVTNSHRKREQRQIAIRLRALEKKGLIERRRFGRGFVGWRLRVDK